MQEQSNQNGEGCSGESRNPVSAEFVFEAHDPSRVEGLEVELQVRREGAIARKLIVKIERVKLVVLVGYVQKPNAHLGVTPPKAPAGVQIQLPEIVSRNIRVVALVRLLRPKAVDRREQARGMIEVHEQPDLVENGGDIAVHTGHARHVAGDIGEERLEIRLAEAVARAGAPLIAE